MHIYEFLDVVRIWAGTGITVEVDGRWETWERGNMGEGGTRRQDDAFYALYWCHFPNTLDEV